MIDGVIKYATEKNQRWSYLLSPESLSLSILDLRAWKGNGIIAALNSSAEDACACAISPPVVNISSVLSSSSVPQVIIDNKLVGELAAEHFIKRGFQEFAFYGLEGVTYSEMRLEGFQRSLQKMGFHCSVFLSTPTFRFLNEKWHEQQDALGGWLTELKVPVGLFAVTDYRAMHVLNVSRQVEIMSPQQIAILGVDNEEVICQHQDPTLSSVARDDQLEGYRAAELLDEMMHGIQTENLITIPPLDVVERRSTSFMAVRDERVRKAIEYIYQFIGEPFDVDEIARHVDVSRRWLEYEFRKAIGESPYQYIRRQRLEHARRLLTSDRQAKIYEIARLAGFGTAKQFTVVFQERYGTTPREYRRSLGI